MGKYCAQVDRKLFGELNMGPGQQDRKWGFWSFQKKKANGNIQ